MKCLVIGGGGFIGSHIVDELLKHDHSVRILSRPDQTAEAHYASLPGVEWINGDFLNQEDVRQCVPGCDAIIHLAWSTLPKSSNDNTIYDCETNLIGTLRLLEISRVCSVKKLIFCSSGGTVYGIPNTLPIPEHHSTVPLVSYGIAKLAVEQYLHLYKQLHQLDYVVLRVSNPFGERQRINTAQGAVAVFLSKSLKGETIEIWGDGGVVRDYVYVGDVAKAFICALNYQGKHSVFNIGSGEGRSLNEVMASIEQVIGKAINRRYLPARKFDVPINVLDISLAKQELGWYPETEFELGLQRTICWLAKA